MADILCPCGATVPDDSGHRQALAAGFVGTWINDVLTWKCGACWEAGIQAVAASGRQG